MKLSISYKTRRGAGVCEGINPAELQDRLIALCKRRVAATARIGKVEVGAVWKNEGRWVWWCEPNCDLFGRLGIERTEAPRG